MKLSVLTIALGLLSSAPCTLEAGADCHGKDKDSTTALLKEMNHNFELELQAQGAAYEVSPADIVVLETEEELDLGFDTADYLPQGFNAYAGLPSEVEAIGLLEVEEEIDLGFDTSAYLPAGFDPYAGMADEVEAIGLIEVEEEEIDLGFDTRPYLPEGFDPYQGMDELEGVPTAALEAELKLYEALSDSYFGCAYFAIPAELVLNDLDTPEIEEDIDLGFDTQKYLPAGFDPYEGMTASVE